MFHQRTVKSAILGEGVGLHSGQITRFRILPAPVDSGIVFVRTDCRPPVEIPARSEFVRDTTLATTLGLGNLTVGTVEHLVAALAGLGVDNARIEIDGPEVPILDGSCAPFVDMIARAGGTVAQRRPKRFLVVRRAVEVSDGEKSARLEPASRFSLQCSIDFDHPIVNAQSFELDMSDTAFVQEVARARTFGFAKDVDAMHAAGLARGGSLDNAVVIEDFSIRNPEGLRFSDEFVRHKALDAVGDLYLAGGPIVGRFVGHQTGHKLNNMVLRALFDDSSAYEWVECESAAPVMAEAARISA